MFRKIDHVPTQETGLGLSDVTSDLQGEFCLINTGGGVEDMIL